MQTHDATCVIAPLWPDFPQPPPPSSLLPATPHSVRACRDAIVVYCISYAIVVYCIRTSPTRRLSRYKAVCPASCCCHLDPNDAQMQTRAHARFAHVCASRLSPCTFCTRVCLKAVTLTQTMLRYTRVQNVRVHAFAHTRDRTARSCGCSPSSRLLSSRSRKNQTLSPHDAELRVVALPGKRNILAQLVDSVGDGCRRRRFDDGRQGPLP